ncbi:MAG: hypothetical protein FJ104_07520, partial [Deltaproteobacteria bacterium]|nr:hypothetical protein [Deltaproteobacteria bacterium]
PRGALAPEAVVLRVRALLALGRVAEANTVAGSFLAGRPDGPQAARIRSLVSGK